MRLSFLENWAILNTAIFFTFLFYIKIDPETAFTLMVSTLIANLLVLIYKEKNFLFYDALNQEK